MADDGILISDRETHIGKVTKETQPWLRWWQDSCPAPFIPMSPCLQQRWWIETTHENGEVSAVEEWRDVPYVLCEQG